MEGLSPLAGSGGKEVAVPSCNLVALATTPVEWKFSFPAQEELELLRDAKGEIAGMIARNKEMLEGVVEIEAASVGDQVYKVRVGVKNLTTLDGAADRSGRDDGFDALAGLGACRAG